MADEMTNSEHAELSAQVARAIGHDQYNVRFKRSHEGGEHVLVWTRRGRKPKWCVFDYRDPTVAMGLWKRYAVSNSLNIWASGPEWWHWSTAEGYDGVTKTAEEAIAHAVLAVSK